MRFFRLFKIILITLRFGLDEVVLCQLRVRILCKISRLLPFRDGLKLSRAVRLRLALEALGPIFIKFGQMLSTRRDLLATDFADELAFLQDRVPPFPSEQAVNILEAVYGRSVHEVFLEFNETPVAGSDLA